MTIISRFFKSILGPAAVMAAGSMGAGAVASLVLAGAWFQYDLLWVVILLLPVFVIGVDSSSRIGFLNRDHGMLSLIRQHIHPSVAWLLLAINLPVHILVIMGQLSVMVSSVTSLSGIPANAVSHSLELTISIGSAVFILWLVLSQGYERMQKVMTLMMLAMFICFTVVALRSFSQIESIILGFIPSIPDNLSVPGTEVVRSSTTSMLAIIGSAIAPAALLGMPYLTSNSYADSDDSDRQALRTNLRQSIINLGVIYGLYSVLVLVAGGFALFPLANSAGIDSVAEAGAVFGAAFPADIAFIGPIIFSLGVFIAATTTLVLSAQVLCYFTLDMLGKKWHFSTDNRSFHWLLALFILIPAILTPFWNFPPLLKVVLMMGINVIVIPLVIIAVIILLNKKAVIGQFQGEWWRNAVLIIGLLISMVLAYHKIPGYLALIVN